MPVYVRLKNDQPNEEKKSHVDPMCKRVGIAQKAIN